MRKATGSFQSGGGSASDNGSLSASVNDFARATAQIHPSASRSTSDVPYSTMASILGQAQRRSITQTTSAFKASVTADGDSLDFEGYEVMPGMQASTGSFSPVVQAEHGTGMIRRLNMSLYVTNPTELLADIKDESMPARIMAITKKVVKFWREVTYPNIPTDQQKVAAQLHEINTEPLQILQRILESSAEHKIDGLKDLLESAPVVHNSVNNWIFRALMAGNSDFWGSFLGLAESFGMLYAPAMGPQDSNGKLFGLSEAFQNAQDRSDVPGLTIRQALGLPDSPVTHVLVPRMPSGMHRAYEGSAGLMPGQVIHTTLRYPEDRYDGRPHILNPPPYISPVFQSLSGTASFGRTMPPGQARGDVVKVNEETAAQTEAVTAFMKGLARRTLHMLQLQGSNASITVPLDLKWEIGTAYRVGLGGEPLFVGLLVAMSHSVSSSPSSPQAFTSLSFNNVQWGGFSLPFN